MKNQLKYPLLLFPAVFLLWYFVYPEHLGAIEAYGFFACTPDYFSEHCSVSGIAGIAGDYLSQFYRWREIGAGLQALLFILVLWGADLLLYRMRLSASGWVAMMPASLFLWMQLRWGLDLAPAVATVLVLYLSVGIVWFLPGKWRKRAPTFMQKGSIQGVIVVSSAIVLLTAAGLFVTDKNAGKKEKIYAAENAAFVSDWNRVLSVISPAQAKEDSLLLRYTLLALSEKEMLTEHLFNLDVREPECFYFYRTAEPSTQYFNSLFYAGLNLYNESIHQMFDATTDLKHGISFRALRSVTDWFLKMGNLALAEKYLTLLERSSCHAGWIMKRKEQIRVLKQKTAPIPDRSHTDIFIGAYPFIPEMWRLQEDDPTNKKKTDYLLCALLLKGDLERFQEVFRRSVYLSPHYPVPKLYRQFALLKD
ncbi:MAG: DUF6057 family protein [Tannerellaceae bacterium]|jgi:hypothetical protein|nr:DUF6057 family protein [Tannerellaceae bacterium]